MQERTEEVPNYRGPRKNQDTFIGLREQTPLAGLSPLQALRAATAKTADVFSLPDRGRIVVGRRADLVMVRGNPIDDITATRDIMRVWRAGVALRR